MESPLTADARKPAFRKEMRARRRQLASENPSPNLQRHFDTLSQSHFSAGSIAGFAPIGDEINIWPLLKTLQSEGRRIALPVVVQPEQPLVFREWTPDCDMGKDKYGISFPARGPTLIPQLVLVPLLAFTPHGERLGYGGGYYDRTLAALRRRNEVFACGVAYAGQEVAQVPTDAHDAKLDGILTEIEFRAFA